ncbi:KTSC domain-containing protein [Haladaptatus pallidirubidus]|uniref:KTSC domain-containing protein n=1 Tax=Haladaptatus pallidirubidus TaxID=1008152 RepID=A0AAV3UCA2_9EURY
MPNQQPISALESTPDEIRVNLGEWVRVQSSNIHRVSYSKFDQVLAIEFHGGREYWYRGVPESIWEGLLAASSKGGYHHQNIKWDFPYVQVRGP